MLLREKFSNHLPKSYNLSNGRFILQTARISQVRKNLPASLTL